MMSDECRMMNENLERFIPFITHHSSLIIPK